MLLESHFGDGIAGDRSFGDYKHSDGGRSSPLSLLPGQHLQLLRGEAVRGCARLFYLGDMGLCTSAQKTKDICIYTHIYRDIYTYSRLQTLGNPGNLGNL